MTDTVLLSVQISRLDINAVIITTVLTFLAVGLAFVRFRLRKRDNFETDEYVLMLALLFLILQLAANYILAFRGGDDSAIEDLLRQPEKMTWLLKIIYWSEFGYTPVVVLLKTSILFSYKRIFGHITSALYQIYILLALSWAWGISVFLVCIFQCTPIDKVWRPQIPGHCIEMMPYLWANSISNSVIDWLILTVPVVPVLKLHLPPTQKFFVCLAFLCGILACIASTVRCAMTNSFSSSSMSVPNDYEASVWIYIEPPLATISCCLPFLTRIVSVKVIKGLRLMNGRINREVLDNDEETLRNESDSVNSKLGNVEVTEILDTDWCEGTLSPVPEGLILKTTTISIEPCDEDAFEEREIGTCHFCHSMC